MTLEDSTIRQIDIPEASKKYDVWYTLNVDDDSVMVCCEVDSGVEEISDNYSNHVEISWVTYNDEFIEDMLTDELTDSSKSLAAISTEAIVLAIDKKILSGTGYSLEEIYNIPV